MFKPRVSFCCSYICSLCSAVCLAPQPGILKPADFSSVPESSSRFLHLRGWQEGKDIAGQRRASSGWHPRSQTPEDLSHSFPSAHSALQLYPSPGHAGAAFKCLRAPRTLRLSGMYTRRFLGLSHTSRTLVSKLRWVCSKLCCRPGPGELWSLCFHLSAAISIIVPVIGMGYRHLCSCDQSQILVTNKTKPGWKIHFFTWLGIERRLAA